jgi:hypothetical protein
MIEKATNSEQQQRRRRGEITDGVNKRGGQTSSNKREDAHNHHSFIG